MSGTTLQSFAVHQELLVNQLKTIFPDVQTQANIIVKNPDSGALAEFDVWVKDHNLCFEFQDAYHYVPTWYYQNTQSNIVRKDSAKKILARKKGLTLVVVPLWWDGSKTRLADLTHFQRPDLLTPHHPDLVPLNPPASLFSFTEIPGVGELMQASYTKTNDIPDLGSSSWWMGEKFDGVRFCWNASQRKIFSRFGNIFSLPEIEHEMPGIFVDGELWFGRGNYHIACQIVSGPDEFSYWHFIRMILFDVPDYNLQNSPFEVRYRLLVQNLSSEHPFSVVPSRVICQNKTHFKISISHIERDGGEGIIIRKVGSLYERDKTPSLIKIKMLNTDNEAIVESVSQTAMLLKLPNGKSFSVPFREIHLNPKPKVGDVVTYTFPMNVRREDQSSPTIVRIRTDISWEDVVRKYYRDRSELVGPIKQRSYGRFVTKAKPRKKRIWVDIRNRRKFFEEYARSHGFDPLVAENWYGQLITKIWTTKGGQGVSRHYKSNLYQALIDLFPNIGLERSKFKVFYHNLETPVARRQFLEKYAKDKGFDPLVPENWYKRRPEFSRVRGAQQVMFHHGGFGKAISDLFPSICVDLSKIRTRLRKYDTV